MGDALALGFNLRNEMLRCQGLPEIGERGGLKIQNVSERQAPQKLISLILRFRL